MEMRSVITKEDVQSRSSEFLRERLVISDLFKANEFSWVQSHHDRILLGGVALQNGKLEISAPEDFGVEYFLQRRELGLACLSGRIEINVDGKVFSLEAEDILYVGRGSKVIEIEGNGNLYGSSSVSHATMPTNLIKKSEAETLVIGDQKFASERTLRKYIHEQGASSSSMAMGITTLHEGNVWNTMPCHVHERRTEAYLYFDIPENHKVVHLYGEPTNTRNFLLEDLEVVISPAWSIHTGAGTSNYKFVWSTAGENITYTDFIQVPTSTLK